MMLLSYSEPFGPQPGLWSAMYLIGNPPIVWGCGIAIILFLVTGMLWLRYRIDVPFFTRMGPTLKTCRYACVWSCFGGTCRLDGVADPKPPG